MKLKTKQNYFFSPGWTALFKELTKFIREVYDDLVHLRTTSTSSLPTAGEDYYGRFYLVPTSGVDDLYVCRKNGSNYEWKKLS